LPGNQKSAPPRVEGLDDAVLVNGDDAFHRGFQDGAQAFGAVAQRGVRPLTLGSRACGMAGTKLADPGQQFGFGHFPIVLHFESEETIGKTGADANLNHGCDK
jgi:hypothetical protein